MCGEGIGTRSKNKSLTGNSPGPKRLLSSSLNGEESSQRSWAAAGSGRTALSLAAAIMLGSRSPGSAHGWSPAKGIVIFLGVGSVWLRKS